jgi:hypothetical protein
MSRPSGTVGLRENLAVMDMAIDEWKAYVDEQVDLYSETPETVLKNAKLVSVALRGLGGAMAMVQHSIRWVHQTLGPKR